MYLWIGIAPVEGLHSETSAVPNGPAGCSHTVKASHEVNLFRVTLSVSVY